MNIKIRSTVFLVLVLVVFAVVISSFKKEQQYESWTKQQLLDPADLAKTLNHPKVKQPIVYSIGPGAIIRGSMDIGPVQDIENLDNLKKQLNALPKDGNIVIYCGCCPFKNCPNIRPAFKLLKEMKFTNQKLLNIQHNVKSDWIDKGFPIN